MFFRYWILMANMRSWSRCVSQNTTLHFQIIGEKRKTYIYCISFFKYFKESQQGEEVVGDDCGPFFFFQISRTEILGPCTFFARKAIRQIMYYCILDHHGCSAVLFFCPSKLPARPDASGHQGLREDWGYSSLVQMICRCSRELPMGRELGHAWPPSH